MGRGMWNYATIRYASMLNEFGRPISLFSLFPFSMFKSLRGERKRKNFIARGWIMRGVLKWSYSWTSKNIHCVETKAFHWFAVWWILAVRFAWRGGKKSCGKNNDFRYEPTTVFGTPVTSCPSSEGDAVFHAWHVLFLTGVRWRHLSTVQTRLV